MWSTPSWLRNDVGFQQLFNSWDEAASGLWNICTLLWLNSSLQSGDVAWWVAKELWIFGHISPCILPNNDSQSCKKKLEAAVNRKSWGCQHGFHYVIVLWEGFNNLILPWMHKSIWAEVQQRIWIQAAGSQIQIISSLHLKKRWSSSYWETADLAWPKWDNKKHTNLQQKINTSQRYWKKGETETFSLIRNTQQKPLIGEPLPCLLPTENISSSLSWSCRWKANMPDK